MSSQKRSIEEIDADLEALRVAVATGERELDQDAFAEAFKLVLERFGITIKLGLEGALEALVGFVEMLAGAGLKMLAALGEKGAEIAATFITILIAKIFFFIMLIMSFATFGLIPAPPNLEAVIFFYKWLKSIFELRKELEEKGDTDSNTGGGNIV